MEKKYENSSQGERSNLTNFQPLLAFTIEQIPAKFHQFLISSFRDFVETDAQIHRQTDSAKNNTWHTGSYR